MSSYQMLILLLYNDGRDAIPYGEIKERTQIPERDLKRHLISISAPSKYRLLRKVQKGKEIKDEDEFAFNCDFKSKMVRVRVPLIQPKESSKVQVPESVQEDRRHLIEAAIVRIMKTRKTLEHSNLIAEVSKQLSNRFMPNPSIVKKRIESLIEREYIERANGDRRLYNYLA